MTRFQKFFFQAEDGIRDYKVTGVQTCALPIYDEPGRVRVDLAAARRRLRQHRNRREGRSRSYGKLELAREIGRASCREGGEEAEGAVYEKQRAAKRRRETTAAHQRDKRAAAHV